MAVLEEVDDSLSVAIVGMAGRFPGANDVGKYWDNIASGIESIRDVTEEELLEAGVPKSHIESSNYVPRVPDLEDADCFDARFFNYSPLEAKLIDPQQRIFLEICWEALEHAGYRPSSDHGPVGVFAGSAMNTYLLNAGLVPSFRNDYLPTLIGSDKDYLATRVSFKLDLKGPSMTVQTACSSSLVAIHTACQSLLNGECDMALAGGVAIRVPLCAGHFHTEGSVFSRDGHVRSFDENANGTVFGSGAGVVLLKPLDQAKEDGDSILAVIRGSAVNNDGASKSDYTAPSLTAQADLIAEAMGAAGVHPESISYIEAHGTGTYLGDPIEVAALSRAFQSHTDKRNYCAVGTVKANIGHLDAAAGVAGLIKVVLALQNKQIPPLAGFTNPNSEIDFENSPFFISSTLGDWDPIAGIRRAGITSLGIGGTNVHVIVDGVEGPEEVSEVGEESFQILPLSAKSENSMKQTGSRLASYLSKHPELSAKDVAHTLQMRDSRFPHRMAVVEKSLAGAANLIKNQGGSLVTGKSIEPFKTSFLFSGQGSQHTDMGAGLFAYYPVYRETIEECCSILDVLGNGEIRKFLLPSAQAQPETLGRDLSQTKNTQPALFAIEYALAKLWQSFGVNPSGMLGHSIGEYVAATLSQVFTLQDAMAIVLERGRLMQSMEPGWMMAVSAKEEDLSSLLPDNVSIAVENGPELFAIGGPFEVFDAVGEILGKATIPYRKLHTSHAFHTAMMEPMLDEFEAFVGKHHLNEPLIPFVSNVTGNWIQKDDAVSPNYWARHIRSTVRFNSGLSTIKGEENAVAIEVGPGQALTSLVRQHRDKGAFIAIPSLPRADKKQDHAEHLMLSAARYWTVGGEIDFSFCRSEKGTQRVNLPGYVFEKTRHWSDDEQVAAKELDYATESDSINLYAPSWTRSYSLRKLDASVLSDFNWLLLVRENDLNRQIVDCLRSLDIKHFVVEISDEFAVIDGERFTVDPGNAESFEELFKELTKRSDSPIKILHCLATGSVEDESRQPDKGGRLSVFHSFVNLFTAAEEAGFGDLDLVAITQGAQCFGEKDVIHSSRSLVEPTCRALTREFPRTRAAVIDLEMSVSANNTIVGALLADPEERGPLVFRDGFAWRRNYEPMELTEGTAIKEKGTYLITGGLGGIGSQIAARWARKYGCNIFVMSRREFPESNQWRDPGKWEHLAEWERPIARLFCEATMEQGSIEILQGDVTSKTDLEHVTKRIVDDCGGLNGVIHAAGGVDPRICSMKTLKDMESVLSPKIGGTNILLSALESTSPDFVILFSSVRALQAPMGLVDYAAANAYLDSIAEEGKWEFPVISINWPGWRDVGMLGQADDKQEFKDSLSLSEGLELLENCTVPTVSRIVVSRQSARTVHEVEDTSSSKESDLVPLPESEGDDSLSESERLLKHIWAEALGTTEIQPEDDFFDLGGSSLLATKCLNKIDASLGVKLNLKAYILAKTLKAIASLIDEQLLAKGAKD